MREKLETFTLEELKNMAKEKELKVSGKTKAEIIDALLKVYEENKIQNRPENGEICSGIFEIVEEAKCGFIRCENFLPGVNDVYVSSFQIRKFDLRTGDILKGIKKHQNEGEKYPALVTLLEVNGIKLDELGARPKFDKLIPIFPNEKLKLINLKEKALTSLRVIDLLAPIGKGQRGLIVSPPKAGKTTLLKSIAKAIINKNEKIHLLILLVDERPEEVTDMKADVKGNNVEVIYSTFDETPERHRRVSEMVVERAKRLVEQKMDVVILLDSLTRLTRAYNLICAPSGRTLSGGLDPASLHMPKKFFGAARNMQEGGSLTILATALVDTGSRMDDVIYEEFKGTGNMELVLDRKLQERRIFPAIDIVKSGTRKEELLLSEKELEAAKKIHKMVNDQNKEDDIERIIDLFDRTDSNDDFIFQIMKLGNE